MEENQFIEGFAMRLTALREKKEVSAREMSLALGQTHSFIHGIESKRNFPSMLNFYYICEYLGVTPKEFFDFENENPEQTGDLYKELKKLDAKSQEYFLGLIRDVNNRPK
ncbi:helix-turn-helix transcriptional regulator [Oscillibacter sp.]|uniref:helix-turn-helix domain-containing protein n=1 Tax=Oscillibacter sp. TaxID=1945593 RepID=UPI00289CF59D|nr:helix-turn-helix transcriptional regulator [Oscillibacter sp.]